MCSSDLFAIAYINVLLVAAVVTVALSQRVSTTDEKRQTYIDAIGLECTDDPAKCGEYGTCTPIYNWDLAGPRMCQCLDGYTSYAGICDYILMPQLNSWFASFFGGWVGADWFYLFREGANKGYPVAGVFKLLTWGGFSVWWLVDWIRVLTMDFYDANGMPLYENLTNTGL